MQVFQTQPNTRMSKPTGSTRILTPKIKYIASARIKYQELLSSLSADESKSYFSEKTGAYVIFMKGHNHTGKAKDGDAEIEAAKALADAGIDIKLTPEGDGYEIYATSTKIRKDGTKIYKYSERKMSAYTFEQRTPTEIKNDAASSVRMAINHANSKKSSIALIYDKHSLFHRKDIENGMKLYQSKHHMWETKGVKCVIVVNSKGQVYEHQFDKE